MNKLLFENDSCTLTELYTDYPCVLIISRNRGNNRMPSSSYIIKSPFANCQTYSIGNFYSTFLRDYNITVSLAMLKEIQKRIGKSQFLVDIKTEFKPLFFKLFPKEDVIFITDYISSNKSEMSLILVNTKSLQ